MDKIIFLDCDGVINKLKVRSDQPFQMVDPSCIHRLNKIIADTGAKLVISSSWRHMIRDGMMTVAGFGFLLQTHGVCWRSVVGYTPTGAMMESRGWEIQSWLDDNAFLGRYVVLDDCDMSISELGHPFVHCDGAVGLTDEDVEKAIAILNG